MANGLKIANLNSGSRGGGGGYSGGGYSNGGGGGAAKPNSDAGTMYVWNNATKKIDALPATRSEYEKFYGVNLTDMASRRR